MQITETQLANRVEWVRALRSRKFKQANGTLKRKIFADKDHFAYCCLGVACELVKPEAKELVIHDGFYASAGTDMHAHDAGHFYGMNETDQGRAINWNDSSSYSFKRIADLVAWATEHNVRFSEVEEENVRRGYSVQWLGQFTE